VRKLKLLALIISTVGNLQLSIGILSESCSVCQTTATSCPAYFLTHDTAENYYAIDW